MGKPVQRKPLSPFRPSSPSLAPHSAANSTAKQKKEKPASDLPPLPQAIKLLSNSSEEESETDEVPLNRVAPRLSPRNEVIAIPLEVPPAPMTDKEKQNKWFW